MRASLRSLWKSLLPESWLLLRLILGAVSISALILIVFPFGNVAGPANAIVLVPILTVMLPAFVVACTLLSRWNWRLALHVRRFRTVSTARVTLHYAPELEGDLCFPDVFDRCHRELVYLTQHFGIELPAPVGVFLFAAPRDIHKVLCMDYGGFALPRSNAIVVAVGTHDREMLRHEFTHLVSAIWNSNAPALLSEGLSVWMQVYDGARSLEFAGRDAMRDKSLTLDRLLTSPGLFREHGFRRYSCYLLAGSFTGFLIRNYGWERYRHFYCEVATSDFRAAFRECFGRSLETAEIRWRQEAVAHDP